MKVRQLIAELQKLDPNALVVLACDAEGNGYSEFCQVEDNSMFCDGEVGLEKLTDECERQGFTEDDVMKEGKKAVVLYP